VYFFVVLPYNTLRKRGEVEQADDAQIVLLTEIRDILAQSDGETSGKHGGAATTPTPSHGPRADAESQTRH
jgi:large conductance mechanosensitive channel